MDPGAMLVIGAAWLVLNALRKAGSTSPTKPPPVPRRPLPDGGPAAAKPSGGPPARLRPDATRTRVAVPLDPTQREGARLEQLLRQLGASLDEAAAGGPMGRAPDRPLTEAEAEEDTESLEVAPEVQSLETDVRRPSRPTVDQDDEAERVVAGRLRAADANLAPRTKADHRAFDERIRQEPADGTRVAASRLRQLRDAVVWREILGAPVSLRDDDDR
jgi:hypothetical protein